MAALISVPFSATCPGVNTRRVLLVFVPDVELVPVRAAFVFEAYPPITLFRGRRVPQNFGHSERN